MGDTSPEAEQVLIEIYRNMPVEAKWRQLAGCFRTARQLHAGGVLLRNPAASSLDIQKDWLALTLGPSFAPVAGGKSMDIPADTLDVLQMVANVLTELEIPYALGGSLASSVLGKPRFTQHADITAEPFPGKEQALLARLGPEFYVSQEAVRQALAKRSSFNIIHPAGGFKIDVFIRKERPFDESLMARRQMVSFPGHPGQKLAMVSAEDIILLKLEWYRQGGEISDRQWSDILGVLEIQGQKLDQNYLEQWAAELKVLDLLERLRQQSASR